MGMQAERPDPLAGYPSPPPPPAGAIGRGGRVFPWIAAPPRWTFHGVVAVPTLWLLWTASDPRGGGFLVWVAMGLALLVAAGVWCVLALAWVIARIRGSAVGSWRWLVVAPVCGLLFVGLLRADVPLRARWLGSLPALDRIAAADVAATDSTEIAPIEVPGLVGTYRVERASRVGDDTWVYVPIGLWDGPFLLAAGFAHLPNGPSDDFLAGGEFYERIEYEHLGGDWYAWSGYW